jgi:hypothetical protein
MPPSSRDVRVEDEIFLLTYPFSEVLRMKGLLIAAGIIAALFVADQQYANGKYASALGRMVTQMRHSFRG